MGSPLPYRRAARVWLISQCGILNLPIVRSSVSPAEAWDLLIYPPINARPKKNPRLPYEVKRLRPPSVCICLVLPVGIDILLVLDMPAWTGFMNEGFVEIRQRDIVASCNGKVDNIVLPVC